MGKKNTGVYTRCCHNPYFNRWFSAIVSLMILTSSVRKVTILILIDGFLQLCSINLRYTYVSSHNPYFNRWFSAICLKMMMASWSESSQSLF